MPNADKLVDLMEFSNICAGGRWEVVGRSLGDRWRSLGGRWEVVGRSLEVVGRSLGGRFAMEHTILHKTPAN
eukprot:11442170-Prorocentrum_lima.AAC.1